MSDDDELEPVYLISTRKRRKTGRYRTQYYRETLDGRPRFGAKADAAGFLEHEAQLVCMHLRAMMPRNVFTVLESTARPPRPRPGDERLETPREPEQVDAFTP